MGILSKKERGDCVRAKRELQQIWCRLYLFNLLDNIKGRTSCFFVDVAQIRWTTYICVSLVLCVYISTIFYVFHWSLMYSFLTFFPIPRGIFLSPSTCQELPRENYLHPQPLVFFWDHLNQDPKSTGNPKLNQTRNPLHHGYPRNNTDKVVHDFHSGKIPCQWQKKLTNKLMHESCIQIPAR